MGGGAVAYTTDTKSALLRDMRRLTIVLRNEATQSNGGNDFTDGYRRGLIDAHNAHIERLEATLDALDPEWREVQRLLDEDWAAEK